MGVSPIGVDYEYGRLREVIVGLPLMYYPDTSIDWVRRAVDEAAKVLPEREAAKLYEYSGKSSEEIGTAEVLEQENRELISIFERFDVAVRRPEHLSREQIARGMGGHELLRMLGAQFIFARDPILVVGDAVIELMVSQGIRISDSLAYRSLLRDRLAGSNARWFAMPRVDYGAMFDTVGAYDKANFMILEGGDILIAGLDVLVGVTRNPVMGSSTSGVDWLQSVLAPQGYRVTEIPLVEQIMHLDTALSLVKPGLAIVCSDAFTAGLPAFLRGWTLIEVSLEEAALLAANGLPIDPLNYVLGYNDDYDAGRVEDSLGRNGVNVHRVFFGAHNELGGSIRCATHPLRRSM